MTDEQDNKDLAPMPITSAGRDALRFVLKLPPTDHERRPLVIDWDKVAADFDANFQGEDDNG